MHIKLMGIYLIRNKQNGKTYVGQSRYIFSRWCGHICSAKRGSMFPIHCALRAYGVDGFTFEILATTVDAAKLNSMEQYWLDKFNAGDRNKSYNVSIIAGITNAGRKLTVEHKRKIGEKAKGNRRCLGRVHSPETRRRISQSNIGKRHTALTKAILCVSQYGIPRPRKTLTN